MKSAVLLVLVGTMLAIPFFAGCKKKPARPTVDDMEETEIRVQDIPAVFARLKAQAKDETFAVFVFSPGRGPFNPQEAINIQFSFEDGSAGLDWVLIGTPNKNDQKKFEQLASALGHKYFPKEKNDVKYLRIEDGDLPRLCERAILDLYFLKSDSKIGLLTYGMRWP